MALPNSTPSTRWPAPDTSVEHEIRRLLHACRERVAEVELQDLLVTGLARLRQRFRRRPQLFEPEHIATLARLRDAANALTDLIDLVDDAAEAETLDDYHQLTEALRELRRPLSGMRVAARVDRELRALDEKLPALARATQRRANDVLIARAHARHRRQPTPCPEGHAMEVRVGQHGPFLGCTQYPNCRHTRSVPGLT